MLLVCPSCCSCLRVYLPLAKVLVLLSLVEIDHVTPQSQNKVGLRERKKKGGWETREVSNYLESRQQRLKRQHNSQTWERKKKMKNEKRKRGNIIMTTRVLYM